MADRFGGKGAEAHLDLDASGFHQGVTQSVQDMDRLGSKAKQTGRDFDGIRNGLGDIGEKMALTGGAIAVGLGIAIKSASDLNETVTKSQKVLGSSFDQVDEFAKGAAQTIGASRKEALDATASFATLFNTLGAGKKQSADLGIELTQLAGDLASFYNTSTPDAIAAIQSGLAGEQEPLHRYNIFLTAARVETEALRISGKNAASDLTQLDKALATQSLILKDATIASGDYVDTQDGLANSTRTAQAEIDNATAAIGQALLPVVADAAQFTARLAEAIAGLNPQLLAVGTYALAGAAGLLLVVGGGAKLISVVGNTAKTVRDLGQAFKVQRDECGKTVDCLDASGHSADMAAGKVSKLKGALAGIGGIIAVTIAVDIVKTGAEFATEGGTPGGIVGSVIEGIGVPVVETGGRLIGKYISENLGAAIIGNTEINLEGLKWQDKIKGLGLNIDGSSNLTKGAFGADVEQLDMSVAELIDGWRKAGGSFEDYVAKVAQAKGVTTAQIEALLTQADAQGAANDAAGEAGPVIDAEAERLVKLNAELEKQAANTRDAADLQKLANQQFNESTNLLHPYTRNAEDAAKATADFRKKLHELVEEQALVGHEGMDLMPKLPGAQGGFKGNDVTSQLLSAGRAGTASLDFDDKKLIHLADTLIEARRNIEKMSDAIANNMEDISMWQERIDLVDYVLGSNEDTLAEWQQQLDAGKVTQEEFNEAVASGKAIRAFDELGKLLDEHRITQQEYDDALKAGWWIRERALGGIQDERAELAKMLPAYAQYISDHDEANRAISDLTEAEKARVYTLTDVNAQQTLQLALMIKFLEAVGQISSDDANSLILDLTQFDPALQQALRDYGLLVDAKKKAAEPAKGDGTSTVGKITPEVDTKPAEETLDTFTDTAKEKGKEAGDGYNEGFMAGADDFDMATVTQSQIDMLSAAYNGYFNAGWYNALGYNSGLVAGMAASASDAYAAASTVAQGVDQASKNALGIHSPSRKAMENAENYAGTFVGVLREWAPQAERASTDFMAGMSRRGAGMDGSHFGRAAGGGGHHPGGSGGGGGMVTLYQFGDVTIPTTIYAQDGEQAAALESRVYKATTDAIDRLVASR